MKTSNIEYKDLSESEMNIMNYLWETKKKLTASEILDAFKEKKWKLTTVSTFLSRMTEKGMINSERCGRKFLYYPAMTPKEWRHKKAWSFIKRNFCSINDFICALDDESISPEDMKKLEEILSKIEERGT